MSFALEIDTSKNKSAQSFWTWVKMHVYLHMVGQGVDKFKSWNPLVAAHHAYIFAVLAVWNTDPVGRTQGQGLFFAGAVEIVEPDGTWRDKREICQCFHWEEFFHLVMEIKET